MTNAVNDASVYRLPAACTPGRANLRPACANGMKLPRPNVSSTTSGYQPPLRNQFPGRSTRRPGRSTGLPGRSAGRATGTLAPAGPP
ncbi:MAG TPA: hypothetical protein VGJ45_34240 [Pseudonocardiaceae bacterium]